MNLPSFLVIGGMKCGSTTLYRDLLGHPEIFIPEKELNVLTQTHATASDYASHFAEGEGSICGDVSTTYSMLPNFQGVAERAAKFLGADTKIVYLVREPVSRAISHHRHMNAWHGPDRMTDDIDEACRVRPELVNYGRYAMQLESWRQWFGVSAIRVVVFEEYVANRNTTVERLARWLGASSTSDHVTDRRVFNRSDGKTVLNPFWLAIRNTPTYRFLVRPWLSLDRRAALRRTILPPAPHRPAPPSLETVDTILKFAREDEQQLRSFLGRDKPIWNFAQVRERSSVAVQHRAA